MGGERKVEFGGKLNQGALPPQSPLLSFRSCPPLCTLLSSAVSYVPAPLNHYLVPSWSHNAMLCAFTRAVPSMQSSAQVIHLLENLLSFESLRLRYFICPPLLLDPIQLTPHPCPRPSPPCWKAFFSYSRQLVPPASLKPSILTALNILNGNHVLLQLSPLGKLLRRDYVHSIFVSILFSLTTLLSRTKRLCILGYPKPIGF